MKRTEIAVLGAPSTGTLRLELSGRPSEDGLQLTFLHDERQTGTLARVLGGRVGLGEVTVPVAVKLQRDIALSQDDRGSVAAKFDKERNVHRRLQGCAADAGQERIVRQLEVWGGPAEAEADSLEPCILCARARHGLTPRCPECNRPDAVLEELQLTDDRGLRCVRCGRQFWSTPKTRDAILEATLRHDPACGGCAFEHSPHTDGCREATAFLSFFRNRVLLLERLDLDLDDYLRWRCAGPAGPRQEARQAFEAHRSLAEARRRQQPGHAVAKVADLLASADLFADVLTGVEHLHHHGVAHLDLKPANVCLRFRGADLEVKVIDLGLSDDPNTLAYLRQAEGPLSLWTDYSAPEFRRPRSRPLGVGGRFREDACELDWPRPEGPAGELPFPGDLLFFEDRDLREQRFRVVSVHPGREGRLVVQAEAEPRHRLWLGERRALAAFGPEARARTPLAVVLEKHCGFPADVYSLGMLLLAVLVGNPDVADFREALPAVQIELEEHLRGRGCLPGRALVQRLLGERSKHLQVFHAYAHRLAGYGVAQPLAEELLGIVLRASLRGDPDVFYLADRGADARPALERLRADLDAVRDALRRALTAAQAAVVREARLAVLDRLRGRLHGRPNGAVPLPRSNAAGRLLYPALDLGAAGDEYCERELAYLSPLAGQPISVLGGWEHELSGPARAGSTVGRAQDFLQRYCRRLDLEESAAAFLRAHRDLSVKAVATSLSEDPAWAEDRARVLGWVDEHRGLAERLERGAEFLGRLRDFGTAVGTRLLTPWDRGLRGRHLLFFRRRAVGVPLNRSERSAIREGEILAALDQLARAVQEIAAARDRRDGDFERALFGWRTWCAGRAWLDALAQLEAEALRQWREIEAAEAAWVQQWSRVHGRLREYLKQVQGILHRYDALQAAGPTPEEVTARLTRAQREGLHPEEAEEAADWLHQNWPAPAERLEGRFALWELESGEGLLGEPRP
jgi:hypothetical protein